MSVKLSAWVWDGCAAHGVKGIKLLVMARLADFSSDEGVCWPSVDTISRQLGAGRSTVITAITQLEKEGWLTRTERRNGQRSATNLYTLNVVKLRAAAENYQGSIPERSKSGPSKQAGNGDAQDSESERPESERPEPERSENAAKSGSEGSESGHDPSVTTDPSVKQISSSENSGESPDREKTEKFLSRHPDAAVYTPGGKSWGTQADLDCAAWIFERVKITNPTQRQPNWTEWANDVRLIRQIDGFTHKEICKLFKRANQDSFWRSNILCPSKLREKWDTLTAKFQTGEPHHVQNTTGESTATRQIREALDLWEQGDSPEIVGGDGENLRATVDCEERSRAGRVVDGADWNFDQRPDEERLQLPGEAVQQW